MNNIIDIKNEIKPIELEGVKSLAQRFDINKIGILLKNANDSSQFNVTIDLFKNGKVITKNDFASTINSTIDDHKKLKSLDYSMRLTNIQLVDDDVKDFTNQVYKDSALAITCNMYITPNSDSNCFRYHVDDQISLITQLHGSKEWRTPLDEDGECEFHEGSNKLFNEDYENEKIILINKGESLLVGQNVLHRVFHTGNDISIHYTFALTPANHLNFLREIISKLDIPLKKEQLSFNYDLSPSALEKTLILHREEIMRLTPQEQIKEFKLKQIKEEFRLLKEGRLYDGKNLG